MIDQSVSVYPIAFAYPTAAIYQHPRDVLSDQRLTKSEKRALLASWASDAAAVPSQPHLRRIPGSRNLVPIDEILSALVTLDEPPPPPGGKPARIGTVFRSEPLPLAA